MGDYDDLPEVNMSCDHIGRNANAARNGVKQMARARRKLQKTPKWLKQLRRYKGQPKGRDR